MVVTRVKEYNFVGMDIRIKDNGTVEIQMKDQILECFEAFGELVMKDTNNPAKHNLFNLDESKSLNEKKMELFHHIVEKLLYVSKRARVDINLSISFLYTRVSCTMEEDCENLRRLLHYLHSTIDMPRITGANGMNMVHIYMDASYTTHDDMKGHKVGLMTLGKGIIQGKATKQKLSTKISTETESVGASDYISWMVWTKWFLEDQKYKLRRKIFYQDNESAMKLESNDRKSAGDKSRHINIRYFFIKDILKRENTYLIHCLIERMLVDYYIKPLQGSLFKKIRNILMGITRFPDEEHVDLTQNLSQVAPVESSVTNKKIVTGLNKKLVTYVDIVRTVVSKVGREKSYQ